MINKKPSRLPSGIFTKDYILIVFDKVKFSTICEYFAKTMKTA